VIYEKYLLSLYEEIHGLLPIPLRASMSCRKVSRRSIDGIRSWLVKVDWNSTVVEGMSKKPYVISRSLRLLILRFRANSRFLGHHNFADREFPILSQALDTHRAL
jgi:hypothetical protein